MTVEESKAEGAANVITVTKPLPPWAVAVERHGEQFIQIDPDVVYPLMIEKLGLERDQYGVEVVRRCAINYLRDTVGAGIAVHIVKRPDWALESLPPGPRGKDAAAQGAIEGPEVYYRNKGLL